ncbi:sigma-70 family RNA polymerase sigma factor [Neorhizobium lilium]|uniref:Sigma-70 family RNA polymerase sigma factor n=1 Tax=Neorhizobium lilium TaxID=2503024 RepID=A0A444LKF8_9HYPH|nr:sigma-70 family RNA polymerase sigma factor [Neorhizobium lilium]RWX80778.1 sigma-70 family RNA polymerase sigma factor [Neorhizobium lilium]
MNQEKRPFDVIAQLTALRRYARSLARTSSDAEDLVHDALVKAYERRATFRTGANLRAWLFAILHNTHIDRHRAQATRLRQESGRIDESGLSYPASQEQSIRLRQVREAFMTLPEEQREALHLVAVEDMTYQEAAESLGIPIGTLMSRISRARARLRSLEDDPKQPSHLRLIGGGND